MLRSLYTASTGMWAQQLHMDTITNNISNVSSVSYKKQNINFKDLMYQTIREPGVRDPEGNYAPAGIEVGLGVKLGGISKVFSQGSMRSTGNDFDMAIQGDGFFQIQQPNGNIGYTRDGTFQRSYDGTMVTTDGFKVYPEIVVPDGYDSIEVTADGYVTATRSGTESGDTVQLGQMELASFVNNQGLKSIGSSYYVETDGSGSPMLGSPGENGVGKIAQRYLEESNVDMVEEMVGMITAQRAYESASKAISTSDEMLQTINGLKR
jgi:flagellar basal-body rod protein FlgG